MWKVPRVRRHGLLRHLEPNEKERVISMLNSHLSALNDAIEMLPSELGSLVGEIDAVLFETDAPSAERSKWEPLSSFKR